MNTIFVTRATVRSGGAINETASAEIRQHLSSIPANTETLICITPKNSIAGALDILPLEKIIEDVRHLSNLASASIDHTNVNAVLDLLNEISAWLPYAARLQANCKYYLLAAEANAFEHLPDNLKATSERNDWRKAQSAEYAALYELAERTCAAITHRCDHLRTFISYAKSEMSLAAFPSGTPK
jgi:hypothetical protein